jgi:extradiol dioxygenase family protein
VKNEQNNITMAQPFHLAFPVKDLTETRSFYEDLLGCKIGRTSDRWIDLDFWGNQLTAHLTEGGDSAAPTNHVDGKEVPVKHFGAILQMDDWEKLASKLKQHGIDFVIEPYIRFQGEPGEQATMFFLDPSGNAIEFKAFKNFEQIFAT